jgi:hypothetical protein
MREYFQACIEIVLEGEFREILSSLREQMQTKFTALKLQCQLPGRKCICGINIINYMSVRSVLLVKGKTIFATGHGGR